MKLANKGFTLIELMIVVVILGVLMSTILPRLTGAQARARDVGRVADLGNIAAALTVFYDDNGLYPGPGAIGTDANLTPECLGSVGAANTVSKKIGIYLEGNQVPIDPQPNANMYLCGNGVDPLAATGKGRYWYSAITKNGIDNNVFILCADMETFQKANTNVTDTTAIAADGSGADAAAPFDSGIDAPTGYTTLSGIVGVSKFTADEAIAGKTQYCILRP
jgi:prepilin-type N-terminal cleavage/methylation domain-containing protein